MKNWKKDFPIFETYPKLVYLDSAATSQKPRQVISAVTQWYTRYNSNVHRGIYTLSQEATEVYENSRKKIAKFIGANDANEIVFVGNDSEGINLVARGWARRNLKRGDVIAISEEEHHSNMVPWMRLHQEMGIKVFFIPINADFELEYKRLGELPKSKLKLVALSHVSNVLGTVNPIAKISRWMRANNISARLLVDGAQSVPHLSTNVADMGCDFLVFSGHKMLGPSGVGVLWAKKELLEVMDPWLVGSHMISKVTKKKATYAQAPDKFEAGTGRLEAVAGLGAAVDYLTRIGMKTIEREEAELTEYALDGLCKIPIVNILGKKSANDRLGVISFNVGGIHAHDVGEILNRRQICVRAGDHCAQPLMEVLKQHGTVRVSLYIYNSKQDIDKLIEGIGEVIKVFKT